MLLRKDKLLIEAKRHQNCYNIIYDCSTNFEMNRNPVLLHLQCFKELLRDKKIFTIIAWLQQIVWQFLIQTKLILGRLPALDHAVKLGSTALEWIIIIELDLTEELCMIKWIKNWEKMVIFSKGKYRKLLFACFNKNNVIKKPFK